MQEWRNFDLEFFDHDTVGDVESVKVRVAASPAGEQRDPVSVEITASLREAADALAQDAMTLEQTIALGKELASVMLPNAIADLLDNSRARLGPDEGIRLRIKLRSLPLADLPWEYVYRAPDDADNGTPERGFLALDRTVSVVRYEPIAQAPGSFAPLDGKPVTVSLLLANPEVAGWAVLDLANERQAIETALDDEGGVQLSVHANATERAMNDVLDSRPHVFHFSGHGQFKMQPTEQIGHFVGDGELLFETESGGADPVSARELAAKMGGSGVRLAVLNSCESARRDSLNAFTGVAPTLVREGVPAVVAMQYAIRDSQALRFARRFYHNLAEHQSIDAAVSAARLAMFDAGQGFVRDWGVPVLYLRSDQAVLFPDETSYVAPRAQSLGKLGLINLILSAALVFVLAFFYLRHIEPRLPFGIIVGGVLAVAVATAMGYLVTLAGDALRVPILSWFRKRRASGVLVGALVILAIGLALTPAPIGVRVVPGKTLISLIARDNLANPLRTYQLVVSGGSHTATASDFRKNGVVVAGSNALATRMGKRYDVESTERMNDYLIENGLEADSDTYISFWKPRPVPLRMRGLGKNEDLNLTLVESGTTVLCRTLPASALTDSMTVVFLEKDDECD